MSKCPIIENPSADLWESFLENFPDGNFEQSFEYGEIAKIAFPRTKVARLAVAYEGKPVGIVQGTYSCYFGVGMTLGVVRGPVVNTEHKEKSLLIENLLEALEGYGRRKRVIRAKMLVPEAWKLHGTFNKLGYGQVGELNEYVVNLEKDVDNLWMNISHNKRRNIRKAMKAGVEVVQSRNRDDLLVFYSMLGAAEKRGGFSSYPLSWFEAVWEMYKPELSSVFLARWNGKDASGVFTVIHGKTVFALAAGSFSEGWRVRPNDLMHWKVMEWACQRNCSKYHMGLVSEPPPTEGSSAWGIWRWKREWKGNLERVHIFDKLLSPRYKLILKAKKLVERGHSSLKKLK